MVSSPFVGFFGFENFFALGFFGEFFLGFLQVCLITVPGCDETFSDLV